MLISIWRTFSRTFEFEGRSSRRELLYYFAFIHAWGLLRLAMELRVEWLYPVWGEKRALEALLIVIAVPAFALMVRRLHDIGCSAWVSLAWLVPFSGAVLQVWMLLDKGDPEENYYGLPPCE